MKKVLLLLLPLLFPPFSPLPAFAAIQVTVENPGDGQSVSGIALISGFAFSSQMTEVTVKLRIDGVTQDVVIPCCSSRQDVVNFFGGTTPVNTGFGYLINYGILPPGPHVIGVEAGAPGEASVFIDHAVEVVRPGNAEFLTGFNLASANVALNGDEVIIAGARVRVGEQTTRTNLRVNYALSSQSLVIGEAINADPVLFDKVQSIFSNCLFSGCHGGENPQAGQELAPGVSFQNIVAVKSTEVPSLLRINPGKPEESYLLQKVERTQPTVGGRMPLGGPPLTPEQIDTLREWILAGAPPPS